MKFPAIAYAAPTSVADAVALLADDEDARPLAGGQTLLPILALRMASPTCLVDLNGIDDLRHITLSDRGLSIGAMVTHSRNARAQENREHLPLLVEAVKHVAHEAIRNRGTIGGSIAHADAAAEMPLVALALDATMRIATQNGERQVAARDFFAGHYTTAIEAGELLSHIDFPYSNFSWAFEEVSRRHGDFALVMAATGIELDGDRCIGARIALGSIAECPLRASSAEAFLVGKKIDEETARAAAELATADLRSHADIHASAQYRRVVGATLVKRALLRAAAGAIR